MTDDFKEQLTRYLTGTINFTSNSNEPQFKDPISLGNNLYSYIENHAVQPASGTYKIIKGKNSSGQDLDFQLLIGLDEYDNSSFIVVLDFGFNPWQFINTYSNGTKFGAFEEMIIDDDGRFYAVEYVNSTETRRFVMLNNILTKLTNQYEYKVVLRQSYNLPTSLQTGTIKKLIKKPLANKYLFCSTTESNYPLLVEFTINVGGENEWVEYTYTTNHCGISGAWASWDNNDNLTFKLACTYTSGSTGYLYIFYNNEGTITQENRFNLPDATADWIQATILNYETIYLSYCAVVDGVYKQFIYNVGNSLTKIFESDNTDSEPTSYLLKSNLYNDGINVYISYNLPKATDKIEYRMGIIYNGIVYEKKFGALDYTTSQSLFATNTFHQFNLYSYYLQLGDMAYVSYSIFNNLNYNGLPYNNINGLKPNSAILYASYDIPIFARNLYNKTISSNTTMATVEIPNTMLDLMLIKKQSLISETNNTLVINEETLQTNIYETLNINFYNTLTMKNSNDPNNEVLNLNGAIRINESISYSNDYYNAQATKVKINYSDGTNYIVALDPTTQITYSNGKATYNFIIYAPTNKNIVDIEILSYDENTSYTTIKGSFMQGKYYTITQDVFVE